MLKKIIVVSSFFLLVLHASSWEKHPIWIKMQNYNWKENDKLAQKDNLTGELMGIGLGSGTAVRDLVNAFPLSKDSKMEMILEQCNNLSKDKYKEEYKNMRVLLFCVKRANS